MISFESQVANSKSRLSSLTVGRTGVADEQLARREEERGRKRKLDDVGPLDRSRKRSRSESASSYSSDSVPTISTNNSRDSSPRHPREDHTGNSQLLSNLQMSAKRRRSRSASMSSASDSLHRMRRKGDEFRNSEINGHRNQEGRYDGYASLVKSRDSRIRRALRSRSTSCESNASSRCVHKRSSHDDDGRGKRRRHSSRSPMDRGRDRNNHDDQRHRRTRSFSESRDRSQVTRNRKSMTPAYPSTESFAYRQPQRGSNGRNFEYSENNERYGDGAMDRDNRDMRPQQAPHVPYSRRDRSLSPFSKRLALTQAMNRG